MAFRSSMEIPGGSAPAVISIICVYNDERAYREIFLESLKNQTYPYEIIAFDNRNHRFPSAAAALNQGAAQATGRYLLFVHQDVELAGDDWLEQAVRMADGLPDMGIAGVSGMKEGSGPYEGLKRGNLYWEGMPWNRANTLVRSETVQTIDECLFIIPRDVFAALRFDEKTFDGWHCYAHDYCLCLRSLGKPSYVIPLPAYHRTHASNTSDLLKYQVRLFRKHSRSTAIINTTNSVLTRRLLRLRTAYGWIQPLLSRWFPEWIQFLREELDGCQSLLDLGCGPSSPVRHFHIPESVGVDVYAPYVEDSRKRGIHTRYILGDVTKVAFPEKSFDVVLCTEVIEHLPKDQGRELLSSAARWARSKVIVTTPNGHVHQEKIGDNEGQRHVSAWTAGDLRRLGFIVTGISGLKYLRTDFGRLKYRPHVLWNFISNISQKFTRRVPVLAFQLFAVKRVGATRLPGHTSGDESGPKNIPPGIIPPGDAPPPPPGYDEGLSGSIFKRKISRATTMKNKARAMPADPKVTMNIDLRESSIIKNSVLNFFGLALPKLVALLAIPFTIRLLGMDRFGILSLIFVVFGYFSFLDLGLSVATVRYIAQAIATKKFELVPKYLWATATFQFFIGLAGGLILTASSSLIAGRILKIPPGLISESKTALIILGLSLPIVLVSASFRGALEAAQRFDLVNIVKAPSSVLNYVMPLVAAALGFGLPGIVVLLFIVRIITLIAYIAFCFRIYPNLRFFIAFDKEAAKPIFKYGIWVQISNIFGPVIAYLERFMIGALLTVQMVSYFTAPGEAIMSLAIIPNSLLITLFPAFSALDGRQDDTTKNRFFGLSLKILLIVSGLVSIILIFFAKEFLTVWLGADFAGTCTGIFRIMVLLFFLNALTNVPYSVLQGIGRVDIMAKLYMTELIISVPLAWVLIKNWGLMGATLSWAARIVVETPLLFAVSMKLGKIKASSLVGGRMKQAAVGLAILAAAGFILKPIPWGQPVFVAFIVLFFAGLWTAVMEAKEKAWILAQIRSWKTRLSFKGK